jgi:hypothetical protein
MLIKLFLIKTEEYLKNDMTFDEFFSVNFREQKNIAF